MGLLNCEKASCDEFSKVRKPGRRAIIAGKE
jgi:hypothetical protein